MQPPDPHALPPASRGWCLLAAASCLLPLLLQLPGHLATGITIVAACTFALSWRGPLPMVVRVLLAIAVVGAVLAATRFSLGRDTGSALLAAMLAIKPSELGRIRDARSLLGFALFAPFATFLLDQGPLSLLLGLFAVTVSLIAMQQLADVESGAAMRPGALQRARSAWWLLAMGLPLAMAAFWLFPRLSSPMWGIPERALARPGLSDRMSPGQWLDLMNDDTVALRAEFEGAQPSPEQMYWRGPVLWNFDGRTWTQPEWLRSSEPAPMRAGAVRWNYRLELEPTDRRQLVALDLPTQAPDGVSRSLDFGLYTARPLSAPTRWQMTSSPPATFEPELRSSLRSLALRLPAGFNPRTVQLARRWRTEVDADVSIDPASRDAAIVQRALRMVRADFGYTLAVPLPGRHAVDEFLFDERQGYCEHFSSAFVVLMRAAGIPARVVTGYAGGYRNPLGDYWVVRRSDAHAWAEVWLPARGWTRVDPTAAVAPERIYDTLADRIPTFGGVGAMGAVWNTSDWLRRGWNDFVLGFDADRQSALFRPMGIQGMDGARLSLLFALCAALALGWMTWMAMRRERLRDPVLRTWRRLGARYARLGLAREPHEAAGDWARRVQQTRPSSQALVALSARFSDWRYAGAQGGGEHARNLLRDLRRHRP